MPFPSSFPIMDSMMYSDEQDSFWRSLAECSRDDPESRRVVTVDDTSRVVSITVEVLFTVNGEATLMVVEV